MSARNAKAGGRVNAKRAEIPARPALTTAQAEQMKNMRKEDLPEEMGMVRSMSFALSFGFQWDGHA